MSSNSQSSRGANLFTVDEITLCAYAARYGLDELVGIEAIQLLAGRSADSIKMKVANIASMLDEQGVSRESRVGPLTGLPAGRRGRRTNWEWVAPLAELSKNDLRSRCAAILHGRTTAVDLGTTARQIWIFPFPVRDALNRRWRRFTDAHGRDSKQESSI
jgi:hypothetical protein